MFIILGIYLGILGIWDWREKEVPLLIVVLPLLYKVILTIWQRDVDLLSLMGGISVGAVLFILAFCFPKQIGKGDGLVLMALGSWFVYYEMLVILWLGLLCHTLVAGGFWLFRKGKGDKLLPFIPSLCLGYIVYGIGCYL